jgi:uncharacterized protein YkwD
MNNLRRLLTAVLFAGPLWSSSLPAETENTAAQALEYLNNLREQAGLIALQNDERLALAAQGHANYLHSNHRWGHQQRRGDRLFTGETPLQRMLNAGYPSRHNSENVSSHSGRATPMKSVNGLMSAIYHRFGFLSFDYDEIGVGYASGDDFHSFVYDMGNSEKARLCETDAAEPVSAAYVYKVCAIQHKSVDKTVFDQSLKKVQQQNQPIVVWPPKEGIQVPPAFYDEDPDPLPQHDVSGYPVSIQFNPSYFKQPPLVSRFQLFAGVEQTAVEPLAIFSQKSDINRKFSAYEFALFPKNRLQWNTRYRAEVDYITADGNSQTLTWNFTTAGFDAPMYVVQGNEWIQAEDEVFYVYSPPLSARDAKSEYLVSFRGFSDVEVIILDAHTLRIRPVGARGEAMFEFHGKRFTVAR